MTHCTRDSFQEYVSRRIVEDRADTPRAFTPNYASAAIQAGWSRAPDEPEGVVRRFATLEERRANYGQKWIYAHSWPQACEIDGLA